MKKVWWWLVVVAVVAMAAGTVVEKTRGHAIAADVVYGSWWFCIIMALIALCAVGSIIKEKLWKKPPQMVIHAAIAVIIIGGGLTTWTGHQGVMTLMPHEETSVYQTASGQATLPFGVTLDRFEVVNYPGTNAPMDFVSYIMVEDSPYEVSMNHILRHKGYRLYQEDYDDQGGTVLRVNHDPWGIGVTYTGYGLLILGMLWLMIDRKGNFRRLLKPVAVVAVLLFPTVHSMATPNTLPRSTADKMGQMYVLYKGRLCPVQTLAKDFTTKLTGKSTYQGLSSEQVFAGYMFYFDQWCNEPIIKVKGSVLRQQLHLQGKRASYMQLLPLESERQSPHTDKNTRAAIEKGSLVRMLLSGELMKIYPVKDTLQRVEWVSQSDALPLDIDDAEYLYIRKQLGFCQELVIRGQYDSLERVFDKQIAYQKKQAEAVLPSMNQYKAERLYNALTAGKWIAMCSITLGLLCFALTLVFMARGRRLPKPALIVASVYMAVLLAYLVTVFVLRWITGGHIPLAGGYDSMNAMAIVISILALALVRRQPLAVPVGMLTVGFCLLVAMISGSNPPVTPLMPVLSSPLLTLHVSVIMCSYAAFFFVMLTSFGGLIMVRNEAVTERLRRMVVVMLYPAQFLLAIGIIIGAVWANVSWGNYWTWDPKEVWALITFIIYAVPLHKNCRMLAKPSAFHLYCFLAFLSVAITYFGVNLVLGGVHAYN
ncbi:MAG: cytochrome c biogenesis protein CcsA [Bacteroidales bacterium]|nr:cytochrome c biogenesis protein CcsA [Bacteroidales bacterium]